MGEASRAAEKVKGDKEARQHEGKPQEGISDKLRSRRA